MAPANVVQEDAYAVSYSAGTMARNVTLAQRAYQYEALTRTSETDANGAPSLLTKDTDRDAQASLQHVVLTYDPVNGRKIYVNGNATGDVDPKGGGGTLADWDDTFALVLGNETSSNRQWQGLIKLVAIHNRALTLEQVQQNFAAGVGERYFLLFSVEHLTNVPQSYVMFEASQLDSYAYLFNKPTFISLDPNASPPSIPLSGMYIGVNGVEARVGQSYKPLGTNIGGTGYNKTSGQLLSTVGAVVALEKGPLNDEFFLSFDKIGTHDAADAHQEVPGVRHEIQQTDPQPPIAPQFGMRTFDELNATFAKITGVSPNTTTVASTYATVKQQLPSVETIDTFLASHQTGIAQLAIAYCSAMVENATARTNFYGGVDVNASSNDGSVRTAIINAVQTKIIGSTNAQPDSTFVANSLTTMFNGLNGAPAGTAMKAACAAGLGSAATTVQ
jgi:hypothetical protein